MSKRLKFETATGCYLVGDWDDVLSLKVCAPKERGRNLYLVLHFKCVALRDNGKLTDFMWIDDDEQEIDGIACVTRRWARDAVFIPNL